MNCWLDNRIHQFSFFLFWFLRINLFISSPCLKLAKGITGLLNPKSFVSLNGMFSVAPVFCDLAVSHINILYTLPNTKYPTCALCLSHHDLYFVSQRFFDVTTVLSCLGSLLLFTSHSKISFPTWPLYRFKTHLKKNFFHTKSFFFFLYTLQILYISNIKCRLILIINYITSWIQSLPTRVYTLWGKEWANSLSAFYLQHLVQCLAI